MQKTILPIFWKFRKLMKGFFGRGKREVWRWQSNHFGGIQSGDGHDCVKDMGHKIKQEKIKEKDTALLLQPKNSYYFLEDKERSDHLTMNFHFQDTMHASISENLILAGEKICMKWGKGGHKLRRVSFLAYVP